MMTQKQRVRTVQEMITDMRDAINGLSTLPQRARNYDVILEKVEQHELTWTQIGITSTEFQELFLALLTACPECREDSQVHTWLTADIKMRCANSVSTTSREGGD